jgi:phosphohistidine phosphatase
LAVKRIHLLRHAKSSWEDAGLADHDRPLAPRGRRATKTLAKHLSREGIAPDLVLCSTALRARETLEGLSPALGAAASVSFEDRLYGASGAELLERLREIPDTVESVMLIGHNPAIERLALDLAGSGEAVGELERKYPTGALATLEFDGSWSALERSSGHLARFIRPRDLE